MATDAVRARCRERLERLCTSSAGVEEIQRESVQILQRVIGFDRWCWPDADPVTLLPGPGLAEHDYGPHLPRVLQQEYLGMDFATKAQAGRGGAHALDLSEATGRDLARSARWDDVLRRVGIGDVAVLACRDHLGCWGWLELYRNRSERPFAEEELRLLSDVAAPFGSVQRRGIRTRHGHGPVQPIGAGVVLVDADMRVLGQTETARARVASLPAAGVFATWGILPPAVYAAAAVAGRSGAAGAHVLGRSVTEEWVQIEAAPMLGSANVAVTLRAATAGEVAGLLVRAHGLSGRERQVAARMAAGQDTDEIARNLFISPWTVQDHLKSVFAKLDVHSRAEAVAKLGGTDRSLASSRAGLSPGEAAAWDVSSGEVPEPEGSSAFSQPVSPVVRPISPGVHATTAPP